MRRLRAGESRLASASSSPAYMIQLAKPDESGGAWSTTHSKTPPNVKR